MTQTGFCNKLTTMGKIITIIIKSEISSRFDKNLCVGGAQKDVNPTGGLMFLTLKSDNVI